MIGPRTLANLFGAIGLKLRPIPIGFRDPNSSLEPGQALGTDKKYFNDSKVVKYFPLIHLGLNTRQLSYPDFCTKKLWEAESGCFDESSKHGLVNNVASSSILRYPLAILHALVFRP